jgi:hypothetical protein
MSLRLTQGDENTDAGCIRSGYSDLGNDELIFASSSLVFDRAAKLKKSIGLHRLRKDVQTIAKARQGGTSVPPQSLQRKDLGFSP